LRFFNRPLLVMRKRLDAAFLVFNFIFLAMIFTFQAFRDDTYNYFSDLGDKTMDTIRPSAIGAFSTVAYWAVAATTFSKTAFH